jgi:hypothetical protein
MNNFLALIYFSLYFIIGIGYPVTILVLIVLIYKKVNKNEKNCKCCIQPTFNQNNRLIDPFNK